MKNSSEKATNNATSSAPYKHTRHYSAQRTTKSSGFVIKKAKYQEMPLVAGFIRSSVEWYRPFLAKKDLAEHEVGQDWIDKNFFRREFYIGRDGEDPVGVISHQTLGDFAYLGYIYLDTKFVGQGFGHRLMAFAERLTALKGLAGMVLIAHPEAGWATKAYRKFGFKKIAGSRDEVLAWQDGCLEPYYEEGFELYQYML